MISSHFLRSTSHRFGAAIGAGVLAASLTLSGCAGKSPQANGTIPPMSTAAATSGATTSSEGGKASAGNGMAVTAEYVSDPDLGIHSGLHPRRARRHSDQDPPGLHQLRQGDMETVVHK